MIALEGASGVGKTATSRTLARTLSASRIPEAYDRLRPAPTLEFRDLEELVDLETTLLYEESRRYLEAGRSLGHGADVVLDTGFLGPVTFSAGLAHLDPRWTPAARRIARTAERLVRAGRLGLPDVTIYLDLGAEAVAARVAADPAGHPPERADLYARVATWERRLWVEHFPVGAPGRLIAVRADRPVPSIVRKLTGRLAEVPARRPPSSSEATRTVRSFTPGPPRRPAPPAGPSRRPTARSASKRYERRPTSPSPP